MVDRTARDRLIELLHGIAAGEVGREDLGARRPRSKDRAVREVAAQAWLIFGDAREGGTSSRLELARDDRRDLERWILFLRTDRDYRWPSLPAWARVAGFIPSILTFGLFWRPYRAWFERQGDHRVWPFLEKKELDESKKAEGRRRQK
jgi:hypothetical protein